MTIDSMIRAVQKELPDAGGVDGVAGEMTWRAVYRRIVGELPGSEPVIAVEDGEVDPRSAKAIDTLLPEVQPYARKLILAAKAEGIEIKVTSALRTYEEQNALYEQGRSRPGNIVTNARGGSSNHNFGTAFDITIFKGGKPVWESPAYKVVGELGKAIGLEWGGDWVSRPDEPHFQLRPTWAKDMTESKMLAEMRARKTTNRPIYT